MSRRSRRRWLALAALPLLLLVVVLAAPWWFDARRVATLALAQADAATGLAWSFDGTPELRWRPRPWLALPRLAARDAEGRTVLAAERLELALPWSTLRGESLRIEAIAITSPDLDLDAAIAWWNAQPPGDGILPVLDGLRIDDARVRWTGGALGGLDLSLPRFAIGEAMQATLSARWESMPDPGGATTNAPSAPADLRVQLEALPEAPPLRLASLRVEVAGDGPVPTLKATGRLQFAPWQLDLDGELAAWPQAWPALPAPLPAGTAPFAFSIAQSGTSALDAEARVALRREDVEVELRGVPASLLAWQDDASAAPLPPLQGRATAAVVELEGARLEGVRIDLAPAPPTPTPTPPPGAADADTAPAPRP